MLEFNRCPFLRSAFTEHHQYYGIIRHPADFLRFRFLIRRLFSHSLWNGVSEDFPSSVPVCLTMSSLILRRCHQPSVRNGLFSDSSPDDTDFVHKIGTRPPQSSLRSYQCVHLCYDLAICVAPFQVTLSSRLACNRFQFHTDSSLRGLRVLPRLGLGANAFPRTQID